MINIGVIGYGYWGPNLVRNFNESAKFSLKYVADLDTDILEKISSKYPEIQTTLDYKEILNDSSMHAVAIATPIATHYPLALDSLKAGKHVLVEKPLADSTKHCQHLIEEAHSRGLTLMVDHTFPYTPAVERLKEVIEQGQLGEIQYFDSTRINLGLFQSDANVIWDLAVHDLSILEYLFNEKPVGVSATGQAHFDNHPVNTAFITLYYTSKFIAHINVNWLAPVKIRKVLISGSKEMAVYDELEATEKLKFYDKGVVVGNEREKRQQLQVNYRIGDMKAPNLPNKEALANVISEFAGSIIHKKQPRIDALTGSRIVKILEKADESLKSQGKYCSL